MATMPTQAETGRPPAPQGPKNEKSLKTLGASESKSKYQHYKQVSKISLKDIEEKQIRAIQQYASGVQSTTSLSSIISLGDGRGIRKVDNFKTKGRRNQQKEAMQSDYIVMRTENTRQSRKELGRVGSQGSFGSRLAAEVDSMPSIPSMSSIQTLGMEKSGRKGAKRAKAEGLNVAEQRATAGPDEKGFIKVEGRDSTGRISSQGSLVSEGPANPTQQSDDESKEDFPEGTSGMSHMPKGAGKVKTRGHQAFRKGQF